MQMENHCCATQIAIKFFSEHYLHSYMFVTLNICSYIKYGIQHETHPVWISFLSIFFDGNCLESRRYNYQNGRRSWNELVFHHLRLTCRYKYKHKYTCLVVSWSVMTLLSCKTQMKPGIKLLIDIDVSILIRSLWLDSSTLVDPSLFHLFIKYVWR